MMLITLCQLLKVVVAESLENTGWSLGDGDGLSLPRGDARRRDRGGAVVLRRTAEDLTWQKKTCEEIGFGFHLPASERGAWQSTFLCSSIRISTIIFWNLMSNMAATVSTWALISVGPKITAMLEGVIRLVSLWLHTLCTHTELSSRQHRLPCKLQPIIPALTWPSAWWASPASPDSSLVTCRQACGFHSVENPGCLTLQHINTRLLSNHRLTSADETANSSISVLVNKRRMETCVVFGCLKKTMRINVSWIGWIMRLRIPINWGHQLSRCTILTEWGWFY